MPFPITCTACHKTFSIADDVYERKVKGRVVTIKCKQCQSGIRVDGTKDVPLASASGSVRPPAAAAAARPPSVAPPPQAPPTAEATPVVGGASLVPAANAEAQPVRRVALPSGLPKIAGDVGPKAAAPKSEPEIGPLLSAGKSEADLAARAAARKSQPDGASLAATPKAGPALPKAQPGNAVQQGIAAPLGQVRKTLPSASSTPLNAPRQTQPGALPMAQTAAPTGLTSLGKANPGGLAQRGALRSATNIAGPSAPKAAPMAPATTAANGPAIAPPVAPPPPAESPATPAAAVPAEMLWAVDYPDGQDRELTLAEVASELAAGAINLNSLVWREGMPEWLELHEVQELAALVPPPPAPPLPAPPPEPQRPRAPSAPAFELPTAVALPKPRPPAPSAPVIDFAPHGPANVPLPTPKPRQPTMAGIGDFPSPSITPPPPVFPAPPPAPPVMVPAPALAAPFANPVQPFGRPASTPVGALPAASDIPDWPQKRSRAPLLIGIILLLAIGAGIYFYLRSSEPRPSARAPISALPAAAPQPTVASPPTGDTTNVQAAVAPTRGALDPPDSRPATTPNAGFAEMFASGARQADGKKSSAEPSQRFDPNAGKIALNAAAAQTAKCRENGGPTGRATVVVTFEPSGKVTSAVVSDPPFAGTSSGDCIANALKQAAVPPFSGLPGTLSKVISIQ